MIYYIGNQGLIQSNKYKHANFDDCKSFLKEDCIEVATDTETNGLFNHKNKVIMLQLSNGIDSFVIDTRSNDILTLKESLEEKTHILHNAKFDYKFLKFHGIVLENIIDTFLNECLLTNGLFTKKKDKNEAQLELFEEEIDYEVLQRELSLDSLATKYLNKTLDKSVRMSFLKVGDNNFTDAQIIYGVEDVLCLPEINRIQQEEIRKWNLSSVANLEYKACLALADIEYNGLEFNKEGWLKLSTKAENNIKGYQQELDNLVILDEKLKQFVKKNEQLGLFGIQDRKVNINWDSPAQILKLLKTLGLTELKSSGEKEIQQYQDQYPLIKKFIDYKKDSKLLSTYGKDFLKWINPETNRIHTEFWQVLETFRVSSNNPNLQNLPAKNEYLNCFIAKKGYKIIGIDYAGQEARIAASGSKDELWVNTFLSGKDLHSEVCKLMFGITDELVRTKPDFLRGKSYRDVAKTINFGVLFGMSEFKLSKTLMISVEEAKALIEKYFAATIQLKSYLDGCAYYGLSNGYIRSYKPYSGIRWFPEWRSNLNERADKKLIGEITRASYNTPVQASGALMTKRALVLIREYIKENNLQNLVSIVHVVHDAIYTECREDFAEEFSKIQSELMIQAGREFNLLVPMGTDISITDYWSK